MEKELMKTLSEHGRLGIAQQFDYSKFLLWTVLLLQHQLNRLQ